MPLSAEDVFLVVQTHGPIIANQIKQKLGQPDSTLINVYLSDLKREGKIRMTNVMLGSSKFFYVAEQQGKIGELAKHLNEKDRRTATKLHEQGLLRASVQDPLTRVSLKNIPDFAKPITVKTGQGEETFYRWYTFGSEEAQNRIREVLEAEKPAKPVPKVEAEPPKKVTPAQPKETKPEQKQPKEELKKETQKSLGADEQSDFGNTVLQYFAGKDIEVLSFNEVRKGSDIDAIVEIPTPVGRIKYFCKAKSKKRSNDGDLAGAILAAKKHMLPALYITLGTVTAKAKKNPELGEVKVVELGSSN